MKQVHRKLRIYILHIVDAFYPIFSRFIPMQTFRYAACGGSNMLLDIALYSFFYNIVLQKKNVDLTFVTISPYIFSFILAFFITFPIGFYLSRYVVWQETGTKKSKQAFRYFLVVLACIVLKYTLLKLFIEYFLFWPSAANILTTIIVVSFSYLSQRHFSFRRTPTEK